MDHIRSFFPRERTPVFVFSFVYIMLFSIGFFLGGNFEFVIYTFVMLAALALVIYLTRDVDVPNWMLWSLSFMGMLHMAGGGVHVGGVRLYNYMLIDLYHTTDPGFAIFRYDQFVHLVGYGVAALVMHFIVRRAAPEADRVLRALVTVLIVMGLGSLNEIAEFIAVNSLPSTGVGDYFNTLLDLSFNTIGAILAVIGYEYAISVRREK